MVGTTARKHRVTVVCDTRCKGSREVPPREHASESVDICLRVGSQRKALRIELWRAITIKPDGTNRKELKDLTSKILIGVSSSTQPHVQISAHCRSQGNVL